LGTLKESVTLPTRNMYQLKLSRPPLPEFVSCFKTLKDEEKNLPNAQTKEEFNQNTYKLMEKAGYDFNNLVTLGKVVEVETYDLNKTQKKIHEQGDLVEVSKVGLGYTPMQPIRIPGQGKGKQNVV